MVQFVQPYYSDILLGRSKTSFNHPGNVYFRTLINESVLQYAFSPTRKDKVVLIKGLLDSFIFQQGCRFLKQLGMQWVDVSNQPIARDKISHAVRDALTTHFKRGIFRNVLADSMVHQQPMSSQRSSKKLSKEKRSRKTKTPVIITTRTTLPCHERDDNTNKIKEKLYQTRILQNSKEVPECYQDHFSPSCTVSKDTGRGNEASHLLSSFFDAVSNSSSSSDHLVSSSVDDIPSTFKYMEHDLSDISVEALDSLENEPKRFYEQEGPRWQSMQNLAQDPFDTRWDCERYHMDACDMWEDDVANPMRSSKFIDGAQNWFLPEIECGDFKQ